MLNFAAISPHPPILIPTISKSDELKKLAKTVAAMEKLAKILAEKEIQTLIVISPHGPVSYDKFVINSAPVLVGNFNQFGDFETELIFRNDEKLIEAIERECQKEEIPLETLVVPQLDHGTLVPLYYLWKSLPEKTPAFQNLREGRFLKILPLFPSFAESKIQFQFGKILHRVVAKEQGLGNYGIVASGDLSHRLTPDAPAGFSKKGKEFDEKLIAFLEKKDVRGILEMAPDFLEEAGECGYRSIVILLGALNGLNWQPEILSYEGPFGVGYLVANFAIRETDSLS